MPSLYMHSLLSWWHSRGPGSAKQLQRLCGPGGRSHPRPGIAWTERDASTLRGGEDLSVGVAAYSESNKRLAGVLRPGWKRICHLRRANADLALEFKFEIWRPRPACICLMSVLGHTGPSGCHVVVAGCHRLTGLACCGVCHASPDGVPGISCVLGQGKPPRAAPVLCRIVIDARPCRTLVCRPGAAGRIDNPAPAPVPNTLTDG